MGIGILGVMFAHCLEWGNVSGLIALVFKPFNGLVFTEGFLFLSGFGLYYSFSKNDELKGFYRKRVNRLLIPFVLISLPFYLERMIYYERPFGEFLLNITSLRFWLLGNDGMWYISVSLLLYMIFPLMYIFIFSKGELLQAKVSTRTILLLAAFAGIVFFLYYVFPDYYRLTEIGILQIPAFVVGIYFGYFAKKGLHFRNDFLFIVLLCVLMVVLGIIDGIAGDFENSVHRLFCITVVCILLDLLEKHLYKIYVFTKVVLEWFGKYTLEMYILHMFMFSIISRCVKDIWGGVLSIAITIIIAPCVHIIVEKIQFAVSNLKGKILER